MHKPSMPVIINPGVVQLCFLIISITGIHAIKIMRTPSIKGKVSPAKNVKEVVMISRKDSVKASVENGAFNVAVSPGIWKVIIIRMKKK
jgi:hypothetical protein